MRIGIGIGIGFGGGAFSPASIPGLAGWYTAGPTWCFTDLAGTTPAADGQAVAYWADRSGSGRHLTQSVAGSRPTLRLVSGLWLVRFDGTDDEINWSSTPTIANTALGVAMAVNPSATASDSRDLMRLRDLALGDALNCMRISSKLRTTFNTNPGPQIVNTAADFNVSPSSLQWTVASDLSYIQRLNGVQQTGTLTGPATAKNVNLVQLGLSNAIANWNGDIYECVVGGSGWNAATAAAIDSFFRGRWGTP